MTTNETLIKVENLEKSFDKIEVLKGISTEIKKGEVVVIIGPSGSGKSTFLRCLNLLEEPTGGHIYFDNADMIITDSFHGSVFSMLMGAKNFFSYIIPTSKTGSRITNLLNTVGLPTHLLPTELEKSYNELESEKVDKVALYDIITEIREHARAYLKNNL